MLPKSKRDEIQAYTLSLVEGVMNFYLHGEAIDCPEVRKQINEELSGVLDRVCKKYNLKPFERVLRCRSDGRGWFIVRMEDKFLN